MAVVFKITASLAEEGSIWYDDMEDSYFLLCSINASRSSPKKYVAIELSSGESYDFLKDSPKDAVEGLQFYAQGLVSFMEAEL